MRMTLAWALTIQEKLHKVKTPRLESPLQQECKGIESSIELAVDATRMGGSVILYT
jgi:hypothetical protein